MNTTYQDTRNIPSQENNLSTFTSGKSSRLEGKLLIVGDEPLSRRVLHTRLCDIGFDIGEPASRSEALALCGGVHYDAVLLDVNAAGNNSVDTLVALRRLVPQVAILMLSPDDNLERKVEALEAGADDYLTKPFNIRELAARINVRLRRASSSAMPAGETVEIGELSLNPAMHRVKKAGRRIHLTPLEFELLRCLMMHPGIPVPHAKLLHLLWGDEYSSRTDCLRTLVRQLRRKLEDNPGKPRYILTESGIGYQFVDPRDWLSNKESAAAHIEKANALH